MNTENSNENPENTSENPGSTNENPENTNENPENSPGQAESAAAWPDATTIAPGAMPLAPDATTLAPDATTLAPDATTLAPDATTLALGATTLAPDTMSVAPDTAFMESGTQAGYKKAETSPYMPILFIAIIAIAIAVVHNLDIQDDDAQESLPPPEAEVTAAIEQPPEPSMETLLQDLGPKSPPEDAPPKPEPRILPHVKFDELGKEAQAFSETAERYYLQGDCANALVWHRKALSNLEKALGHLTKQVLWFEEKLGPDHDTTAKTRDNIVQMQSIVASTNSNIGEAHRCQKQYTQAMKWFQQALTVQENTKDANTATTYNNIALVYDDQHNYTRALEWLQKDLGISEAAQNTSTATTYNNIGLVHFHQGDVAGALEWYRKALTIQEKLLGEDAPGTAIVRGNIGEAYRTQEDYANALPELLRAYQALAGGYGEKNPNTLAVRGNLARAYDKTENTKPFAEWLVESKSQ